MHQYLLKRHLGCFDEECVEVLPHENEIAMSGMEHSINSHMTRLYSITRSALSACQGCIFVKYGLKILFNNESGYTNLYCGKG